MRRLAPCAAPLVLAVLMGTGCAVSRAPAPGGADPGAAPAPQSAPAAGPDAPAEDQIARAVFDRVNAERVERGLAEVSWNEGLATLARDWSEQMAGSGEFVHQDLRPVLQGDRLPGLVALGENIFTSSGPVPAGTVHVEWMRSDEHRANLLDPGWDRLGIGVVCAADGSVWATQEFGRTAGSDRPAVARTTPPAEPLVAAGQDGPSC
ncbi:CAP domain-containing protein [Klenkia sp. LSe6-5]|uniref:CAP domain-containing protein n=1 Tax=Klenkia sesuvii TaxID=3103137 RepID=A0ABU8DXR3_9ACTN